MTKDSEQKPSLWRALHSVFADWATYPQPPRKLWSALVLALADWLVPEETEPPVGDGEPWPASYQARSDAMWEQRQLLRPTLISEVKRAETGE